MALSSYSDLKTAIADWMARTDISGNAADFIMLAEARLNRVIGPVTADAMLSGVISSRSISLAPLAIVKPLALHIKDTATSEEREVLQRVDGSFSYSDTPATPTIWAIEGQNIDFDCPCDAAYAFRLTYQAKLALSDSVATNWLLRDHPDVYLAASIVWGASYVRDAESIVMWKSLLDEFVLETRNTKAQERRSTLTVDPALLISGRSRR